MKWWFKYWTCVLCEISSLLLFVEMESHSSVGSMSLTSWANNRKVIRLIGCQCKRCNRWPLLLVVCYAMPAIICRRIFKFQSIDVIVGTKACNSSRNLVSTRLVIDFRHFRHRFRSHLPSIQTYFSQINSTIGIRLLNSSLLYS